MSIIIGADAARLAGLQIDSLQKVRSGQLSLDHWERFNNLSPEVREERFGDWRKPKPEVLVDSKPIEKFALLVDLGIITVPEDYDHAKQLAKFIKKNRKKFYGVNEDITDANFSNPSRILKPGDRLWAKAYQQVVPNTTTSVERMAFLEQEKMVVYTGAQGASLVFEQKRDQLPKGKWYASFDKPDRLWKDPGGDRRVPGVSANSDGDFYWDLGGFENVWSGHNALLGF